MYERLEECRQDLPAGVIQLLATSISVNTAYTSRVVVSRKLATLIKSVWTSAYQSGISSLISVELMRHKHALANMSDDRSQ